MATRRNVTANLESSTKEFPKPSLDEKSNITPAVPAHVIYKLLGFTFAMIIAPIGTYFLMNSITSNSTWSGATAAIVANLVVIGYVIVAFQEDADEAKAEAAKKEGKKEL